MVQIGSSTRGANAMNTSYRDTLLGLLPPVSYARNGEKQQQQAQIDGAVWDGIQTQAQNLAHAITPQASGSLIAAWERVLGLDGTGKSYAQRVSAAIARINATGGLSIPYFINLAASAGYNITIAEPQPFRAGINRAGDVLAPEDIIYTWRVNVVGNSQTIWQFRAGGSTAGERLSAYSDAVIEHIIQDLKPAHTWVGFAYGI